MNGDLDDIASPVGLEDDQALWQVLGRAKKPGASPYFARRVLRETASLAQRRPASALWRGLQAWWRAGLPLLRPPRAAAWSGGAFAAAAICAVTVLMTFRDGSNLHVRSVDPSWQPAAPDAAASMPPTLATGRRDEASFGAGPPGGNAPPGSGPDVAAEDTLTQQDAEVIADLDTLLAREETHLWIDDSTAY